MLLIKDNKKEMRIKMTRKKTKAQIWIETAIYTLIGLTIIAIVLSIATPQIQKMKERAILKQTITALNELNNEIKKVEQTAGTIKIIQFKITKGKLEINSKDNKISYTLENTNLKFSEEEETIKEGDLSFKTEKYGRRFNVILELVYDNLDITYNEEDETKTLHGSALYNIQMENVGDNIIGSPVHINFKVG